MKSIDVKDNTYINIGKEVNDKDPKFKVGDHVRISFLLKATLQIGLKKFLRLKELQIQFHGHMSLKILMAWKLLEYLMKKNCKRQIKKNLE